MVDNKFRVVILVFLLVLILLFCFHPIKFLIWAVILSNPMIVVYFITGFIYGFIKS